ncbi:UNVERIFIED_CONTAM: hypothetical protein NCL1_49803 [Trichonephila clavipes]
MLSWEYLWPTLRCRRVAGVNPLLSIGWWYLSSVSPKRHCYRVIAADKGCRVYSLDPYSGCTPGKRRVWCLPDDGHTCLPCWTWWVEALQDEYVYSYIWIQCYSARVKALFYPTSTSTILLEIHDF